MRLLCLTLLLGLAAPAGALITIGDEEAFHLAPTDGSPWQNVAQVGGPSGSAVYLGNGFLLTADHVDVYSGTPSFPILLNGVRYELDATFGSGGQQTLPNADLKVLKIVGNPDLPAIQLTGPDDEDLGQPSVLIGWGKGKGTPVPNQGWQWAGPETALERHGTNDTEAAARVESSGQTSLVTRFDANRGDAEAQLTLYDSGSGLFQLTSTGWKLAGIGFDVDAHDPPQALYDSDLQAAGAQPDASYYLRMKTYRTQILAITNVPEPTMASFCWMAGALLAGRRARRRT